MRYFIRLIQPLSIKKCNKEQSSSSQESKKNILIIRKNFIVWFALLLVYHVNAQSLKGRILDKVTQIGIPYATVQYATNYGTISNEEGYFTLNVPENSTDSLVISSMGYRQERIPITTLTKELRIFLEPSVIELDEVLLRNRMPTAEDIIREVRAAYPANYVSSKQKYQIFFRETSYMRFNKFDVEIDKATAIPKKQVAKASKSLDSLAKVIMSSSLIEFEDLSGFLLLRDKDSSKIAIDKATKLLDSEKDFSMENVQEKAQQIILQYLDTTLTYKLKTGLFKIEDSLALNEENFTNDKKQEFSNKGVKSSILNAFKVSQFYELSFLDKILTPNSYRFSLDGASFFQGHPIYVLSFVPRKSKAKFTGKLYISASDYAVLKADYSFSEGKEGRKFNMKLLLGIKYLENRNEGTIIFKIRTDGKYHPYYVKREYGNFVYLHRPLKFIENSKERNKVVFDFKLEGDGREKKELLLLGNEILNLSEYKNLKEHTTIPYSLLKQFEPTIWQNNQIIEPLEEMKNFKANN